MLILGLSALLEIWILLIVFGDELFGDTSLVSTVLAFLLGTTIYAAIIGVCVVALVIRWQN